MGKNLIIVVLVLFVIAAGLFGFFSHQRSARENEMLSQKEQTIAQLNANIRELNNKKDKLHEEAANKSNELQNARQTVSKLRKTIASKDQELNDASETIQKLKHSASAMNQQLAAKEDAIKELQGETQKKQATINHLREQISEIQQKQIQAKKSGQQQIEELRQAIHAKSTKLEKEKDKIAQLNKTLSELKAMQTSAGSKVTGLQHELSGSQSKLAACQIQIDQAQKTRKQLKQDISQLKERKQQIESKLAQIQSTSKKLTSKLQKHIQNQEVTIKQYKEKLSVRFLDRILFKSGQTAITSRGKTVLSQVGKVLNGIQGEMIQVVGNTDNVPIAPQLRHRFASNWELSVDRAAAVVRFFQEKCGVDPHDMEAVGRSSYSPVASNATPHGRAQNRNVEIIIKPKLSDNSGPGKPSKPDGG